MILRCRTIVARDRSLSLVDLSNHSVLTGLVKHDVDKPSIQEQEQQVEEYLISMCLKNEKKQQGASSEASQSSDAEESRSLRTFSEITREAEKYIFPKSFEELWQNYLTDDCFMQSFTQSPFFRALLNDPAVVRGCLLSHPLIIKLIELNPGLDRMIQQDENVRLVMQMILARNRPFAPEVRSEVLRRLEEGIGRKLVFAPEHVSFFCLFH